jgi:hypothetical protein
MGLPPDLDRLGNVLTHATARAVARRRVRLDRRRRIIGGLLAGLLVFAAMAPAPLQRADQPQFLKAVAPQRAEAAMVCEQPRGRHFHFLETCSANPQPQAGR